MTASPSGDAMHALKEGFASEGKLC